MSADDLNRIISTAVATALAAGGAAAPAAQAVAALDDEADNAADYAAMKKRDQERQAHEDEAADAVVRSLVDPRHLEIFDWLLRIQNKRAAQLLKEFLRSALIANKQAFREAQGQGGSSSKNIEVLSEKLARK